MIAVFFSVFREVTLRNDANRAAQAGMGTQKETT